MSELILEGTVDRIALGFAAELHVEGAVVAIEGPAQISDSRGVEVSFDPEGPQQGIGAFVALLHADVKVLIADDAALVVTVDGSSQALRVDPSEECEAWSITTVEGNRYVCGLDGAISRWKCD